MSHTRITVVSSVLSAALAALLVLLVPRRAGEPRRVLPQPGYLSAEARAEIHRQMNRHGSHLIELSWDVLVLDDEATAARAERLSSEPTVARTAELPPAFFTLENEMLAAAVRLSQAAREHDSAAISQAYGQLSSTCVSCHRLYLRR